MRKAGAPADGDTAGRTRLGRKFWALWASSTCSSLGDGLNSVALPLLAATVTRQPVEISAVLVIARLPWLVVAIPAGAYADRTDRARLMRRMDLVRAVLLGAAATLVAIGHITIGLIYVLALAVGVCDTFFSGSTQAVLPAIVESDGLASANGLLYVGSTATEQTAGPAVGGLLFSLSRTIPFAADAASFVGSAAFLVGLGRQAPRRPVPGPAGARAGLWSDMRDGLAWYRRSRALCVVTGTVAVLAFCQAMVTGILVLFALEDLHLSEAGYGLFMAAMAVGNIVGGVIASRVVHRFGTATVTVAAAALAAVGYLGAGVTSSPYLAAALLGLETVSVVAGNVATISFRQQVTPPAMQARVANVWRAIVWGAIPFGALVGGILGAEIELRLPFFVAAGLQAVLVALVARPLHRLLRPSTTAADR